MIGNDFIYLPPKNSENSTFYNRVNFIGEIHCADDFDADQFYVEYAIVKPDYWHYDYDHEADDDLTED